jgi:hypothetical protein
MNKVREWYITNQDAISWFIIGFLIASGLSALAEGRLSGAAVNFVIAGINYWLIRYRL